MSGLLQLGLAALLVAATPPMGWNSFDAYDCSIDEAHFKATVDLMARDLLPYGWQYAVIDYIWFNPSPGTWNNPNRRPGHPDLRLDPSGKPIDRLTIDAYGRLLPSVERFPSAANGQGFRPIADYVHSRGMKFGIHVMRGIPRQAYFDDLPILGSRITAKGIAVTTDTCPWNNNMFGIDASKPGAQAYYNSLFRLYAEWGVDFVKVDDMLFPDYHQGELELIRRAIRACGRPMVLSLSPGEAPLSKADHLRKNAQMWRVSADFWDNWDALRHNFDLLNSWSPYIGAGSWPDADMLPIGHISIGGRPHGPDRLSQLTRPEHYTLLTLDAIARSPLMIGADLLTSPESSLAFLKNRDVIAVNQTSRRNRQVYRDESMVAWAADSANDAARYIALFNLLDRKQTVRLALDRVLPRGQYQVEDLWSHRALPPVTKELAAELDPHSAALFRLSRNRR